MDSIEFLAITPSNKISLSPQALTEHALVHIFFRVQYCSCWRAIKNTWQSFVYKVAGIQYCKCRVLWYVSNRLSYPEPQNYYRGHVPIFFKLPPDFSYKSILKYISWCSAVTPAFWSWSAAFLELHASWFRQQQAKLCHSNYMLK